LEKTRINKFLAERGICSRRAVDKLIEEGKILINGKKAQMGEKVGLDDSIEVDGRQINKGSEEKRYIILNKPKGIISAVKDDRNRKTVVDIVGIKERIYPIGRLDYDTEGLILLTNDGDLFNKVVHPRSEIYKVYVAKVRGRISDESLGELSCGIELEDGMTLEANVRLIERDEKKSLVEIGIREGRNRQVRRMFSAVGNEVIELERISIGKLTLEGIGRGQWRDLIEEELEYLRNM
jgi:23S rRNA pseudouridine2605 synthase